jgi:WD40 repeat protein
MRLLPRSPGGTWAVAVVAWLGLCAAAWYTMPPRPRAEIGEAGTHGPRAFSPDGRWLVTESFSGDDRDEFRFWDAVTGQPISHLPRLPAQNGRVTFSPDGHWLLLDAPCGPGTSRFSLWDLTSGERVATPPREPAGLPAFSPTEPLLAWPDDVKAGGPRIRLLELPSLRVRAELPGVQGPVAFAPDGHTLATAGSSTVIWDVPTARQITTLPVIWEVASELHFTRDGRRIVIVTRPRYYGVSSTGKTCSEVVWEVPAGKPMYRIAGERLLSSDPFNLLVTIGDQRIRGYDLDSGAVRYSVDHGFNQEDVPTATAGGGWIAGGNEELTVTARCRIWLAEHGLPIRRNAEYRPHVNLFDAATGRLLDRLTGVQAPLLSSDGRTLAVVTDEHVTQLWDLPPPRPVGVFAAVAAGLTVPYVGLAWRRSRRLRARPLS